jgi:hypothetical protein
MSIAQNVVVNDKRLCEGTPIHGMIQKVYMTRIVFES